MTIRKIGDTTGNLHKMAGLEHSNGLLAGCLRRNGAVFARNHDYSPQFRLTLEKTAPSVEFALPAPGLYDITITDALNTPRINLFLAAIQPSQSADFQSFP
jgi:hypothetical protein